MKKKIFDHKDPMICPNCGYVYAEPADDFVVPSTTNITSFHNCDECDAGFYASRTKDGKILVE